MDDDGPYAFHQYSEKALWCCSFHGPLALNEFKSYLAVPANDGIFYNFPVDFHSPATVSRAAWMIQSRSLPPLDDVPVRCEVKLTRQSGRGEVPLFIRWPEWAEKVVIKVDGKETATRQTAGYVRTKPLASGSAVQIDYWGHPYLESRRFQRVDLSRTAPGRLDQVVVRYGPHVMLNADSGEIQDLVLQVKGGAMQIPKGTPKLVSWSQLGNSTNRHAFVFNVRLTP